MGGAKQTWPSITALNLLYGTETANVMLLFLICRPNSTSELYWRHLTSTTHLTKSYWLFAGTGSDAHMYSVELIFTSSTKEGSFQCYPKAWESLRKHLGAEKGRKCITYKQMWTKEWLENMPVCVYCCKNLTNRSHKLLTEISYYPYISTMWYCKW